MIQEMGKHVKGHSHLNRIGKKYNGPHNNTQKKMHTQH